MLLEQKIERWYQLLHRLSRLTYLILCHSLLPLAVCPVIKVAPPYKNIHPDGSMIIIPGKSWVLSSILPTLPEAIPKSEPEGDVPSVLIIDEMCIVNMVPQYPIYDTCYTLCYKLCWYCDWNECILRRGQGCIWSVLTTCTRFDKRNNLWQVSIQDNTIGNTEIKNIKDFRSHSSTNEGRAH